MSKKKVNKGKGTLYYNGIPYDSLGELEFIYYLEELKENGFIKEFKRCHGYLLSEPLVNNYLEQLKTKSRQKTQTILYGHQYTPDFEIHWNEIAKDVFFNRFGEKLECEFIASPIFNISYIEAKPDFDFNQMTRLATVSIKWMYEKYKVYIQIIKNQALFKATFVPKKLLFKQNGQQRAYKFSPKTLDQYLKSKNYAK